MGKHAASAGVAGAEGTVASAGVAGSIGTVASAGVAGSIGTVASAGVAGSIGTVASAGVAGSLAVAFSAGIAFGVATCAAPGASAAWDVSTASVAWDASAVSACAARSGRSGGVRYAEYPLSITSLSPHPSLQFFVPGVASSEVEDEYTRLHACARRETGFTPTPKRISGLDCRVGGLDCTIEVGEPHPVAGDVVVAILDLGRGQPYGIFTQGDNTPGLQSARSIYAVRGFG